MKTSSQHAAELPKRWAFGKRLKVPCVSNHKASSPICSGRAAAAATTAAFCKHRAGLCLAVPVVWVRVLGPHWEK